MTDETNTGRKAATLCTTQNRTTTTNDQLLGESIIYLWYLSRAKVGESRKDKDKDLVGGYLHAIREKTVSSSMSYLDKHLMDKTK